ncbi:hypothetical protein [Microbispora sp. CA-102843]|uniref:hypothetical protein n=1 Tax=Microbispora sp. CA-102843 TaxID=3239952 RepID=UPI003D8E449B
MTIPEELRGPNAHGQARWWAQLGFRTGEAASLGWMTKRNGWAITEAGVRALDDFQGTELYRELARQYRARRLPPKPQPGRPGPTPPPDPTPAAFEQFQQNLEYARQLVDGGRSLERLAVGSFDVTDLYRAAWTQAVAALDHWVTREIVDRAVALALTPGVPRPPKFNNLSIPVELFERVHHHDEPLGESFRAHLERHFSFMTFQNPEKIKEGLAHVSTVNLWVKVAEVLTGQDARSPISADGVRTRLREIAWRRNNIAHTADHDPERPGQKTPITAAEAEATIEWLETMAIAIQLALGDPFPAMTPDTAGELRAAPLTVEAEPATGPRGKRTWDEPSFLQAVEQYCPDDVRDTLLAVYRHAESHPSFHEYYFGEGEYPSVTAWFNLGSDKASVWSVYTGPAKSVLAVNFGSIRNHGASRERMTRLAERLGALPGAARLRDQLESAGYAKYPSFQPAALARPEYREIIIAALNEFLTGEPLH